MRSDVRNKACVRASSDVVRSAKNTLPSVSGGSILMIRSAPFKGYASTTLEGKTPIPVPAATSCSAAFRLEQRHVLSGVIFSSANQPTVVRYIAVGGGVVTTVDCESWAGVTPTSPNPVAATQ